MLIYFRPVKHVRTIQMSRTGAPLLGCLRYSKTGGNNIRAQKDAQDAGAVEVTVWDILWRSRI